MPVMNLPFHNISISSLYDCNADITTNNVTTDCNVTNITVKLPLTSDQCITSNTGGVWPVVKDILPVVFTLTSNSQSIASFPHPDPGRPPCSRLLISLFLLMPLFRLFVL